MSKTQPASVQAGRHHCGVSGSLGLTGADSALVLFLCPACFVSVSGAKVRIRGQAVLVHDDEADAYFATRPRLSQISAWASRQSRTMEGYFELETAVAKAALRFGAGTIPRPPFWSGFRVAPERIEFWHGKPFRRHHRILYVRAADRWQTQFLYP
jgi:pyridoxamine 5'-phosphate oxidase